MLPTTCAEMDMDALSANILEIHFTALQICSFKPLPYYVGENGDCPTLKYDIVGCLLQQQTTFNTYVLAFDDV